jgi:CheY-like chemotaxis protein
MSVLVVDDEDSIRDVVIAILEYAGYQAAGAVNGRDAIDCLKKDEGRFRLVLLDVMMPLMNAWDVLYEVRQDPALAAIPMILMTAGSNARQKAMEQGAAGYLPKPIDIDALLDTVEYYYAKSQPDSSLK